MNNWTFLHPNMTFEHLGFIPMMLSETDKRPAKEQLDSGYQHGGGWHPFNGFRLNEKDELVYPGDPPMRPLAKTKLRDETIIVYEASWVAIIQPDRSFEVSRMD